MTLTELRFCTQVRRIVGVDEFHAGVFSSERCMGCERIPPWMEDMVWSSLKADVERARYHLELLAQDGGPGDDERSTLVDTRRPGE